MGKLNQPIVKVTFKCLTVSMTTTHTHTHATLVLHVLALSPPPPKPPPPNTPDRIGISGAKPLPSRLLPHGVPLPPRRVAMSTCSRFGLRPLGSENCTLGTKLDVTSPLEETNFSPCCFICLVFSFLFGFWSFRGIFFCFVFLKTAASEHCFFDTAFSTKMPKTARLGKEKRDCSTRSIHFSRRISWNTYHVCSSLSLLCIVTGSCRCQILPEGSEVLEI